MAGAGNVIGGGGARLRPMLALLRRAWYRARNFYAVAGLLLSAGLALSMVGLWGLLELTEEVLEGETRRFDEGVLRWIDARASPELDRLALEVTALGNTAVVFVLAAVAASLLYLVRRRLYALLVVAAVVGAGILNPALKLLVDRPRPQLFEWRVEHAAMPSFPSGHATYAMALFLALAYVAHRLGESRWVDVTAFSLAGVLVLLVGLSRLYVGVHYPSDVLAGYAVGFVWVTVSAVAVEMLRHLRRRPPPRGGEPSAARTRDSE